MSTAAPPRLGPLRRAFSLVPAAAVVFACAVAACGDDQPPRDPALAISPPSDAARDSRPVVDAAAAADASDVGAATRDASAADSDALDAGDARASVGADAGAEAALPEPLPSDNVDAAMPASHDAAVERAPAPPDARPPVDAARSDAAATGLASGLVLYLALDDGPGSIRARDDSGHANTVTFHGLDLTTSWTTGRFGMGLALRKGPGAGHLSVAAAESLNQISKALTIAAFIARPENGDADGTLVSRRALGPGGFLYSFQITDNRPRIRLHSANGYRLDLQGELLVPRGRFVHVAVTYDMETARLYVDGKLAGTGRFNLGLPAENSPIVIGAAGGVGAEGAVDHVPGVLDEVVLWARALGPTDIAALAAGTRVPGR